MNCRLLLVDDQSLIRAGVRALVSDIPGYEVIGEADDGGQLLDQARTLMPDIILLDLNLPDMSGTVDTYLNLILEVKA